MSKDWTGNLKSIFSTLAASNHSDEPETEMDLDIVSNPPYARAQLFVEKSLQCISKGHKVVMFLKLQFLEGKSRRILFDFNPPKYVYVSSSRLLCAPNGVFEDSKSSAVCYAWFVWVKGFKGEPTIRWFN